MTRRLPWKNPAATKTSRTKRKSKDEESDDRSSSAGPSAQDKSKTESSDQEDDENWRMTESELGATARLWTQVLHQKAYDDLFKQQQKEIESSKALNELLEESGVDQISLSLPPRIPDHVPVQNSQRSSRLDLSDRTQRGETKNKLSSNSASGPSSKRNSSIKHGVETLLGESNTEKTTTTSDHPEPEVRIQADLPKLSESALARRRKRQQRQGTNPPVVPMF